MKYDRSFGIFRLHLSKEAAIRARNCLAREIYKLVFECIIDTFNGDVANISLPFIGIMDITGFGNKRFNIK